MFRFFARSENKTPIQVRAFDGVYLSTAQLLRHDLYCPISMEIRTFESQFDLTILL